MRTFILPALLGGQVCGVSSQEWGLEEAQHVSREGREKKLEHPSSPQGAALPLA